MEIFMTQITLLLYLVIGNILFGSLPCLLCKLVGYFSDREDEWNRKIKLSTLLLYTGIGVFIADSFVILLPKTNNEFTKSVHLSQKQDGNSTEQHTGHHHESIPLPEFIILCSFFFAYVGQEIIFFILTKLNKTSRVFSDKRVSYCSCAKRHTECSRTFKDAKADQTLFGLEKKLEESGNIPNAAVVEAKIISQAEAMEKPELLRSSILAQPVPNYGTVMNVTEPPIDNVLPVVPSPVLMTSERRIIITERNNETRYQNKFLINSILTTVALTLQYVFLGIRLELETERLRQFMYLCIICLSNFILNFSIGSYFVFGNMDFFCYAVFIGLLSLMSPLGLIIAMLQKPAVQELSNMTRGIIFAISCGILLYTTFCGMLRQKNLNIVNGLTKFIAVLCGSSIIIGLQYLSPTL